MNYPLKNNDSSFGGFGRGGRRGGLSVKKNKTGRAVAVCGVFLLLIFVLNAWKPNLLSGTAQGIGWPFWEAENWAGNVFGVDGLIGYFQSKNTLETENTALQTQLETQSAELQTYDTVEHENEILKEAFGRTDERNLVLAEVLQGPPFSPYDTFLLDVGTKATSSSEAIRAGQTVLLDGILPIGTITEVGQTASLARLYSSPGTAINVIVMSSSTPSIPAMATGMGDGNFEVTLPRNASAAIAAIASMGSTTNESGAASASGQVTDNGLPVIEIRLPNITAEILGIVVGENTDISQATETLYFRSGFNLNSVRQVYVDTSANPTAADIYQSITATST